MKPEYVASKSIASEVTFLRIILCILIVPIFYLVYKILAAKCTKIEFYQDQVIARTGIISKKVKKSAFLGVYSVSYEQSVKGRIFNYGNVHIDISGKWDINTESIKNPVQLAEYLETRTIKKTNINQIITD